MGCPDRATIDLTVVYDLLDETRPRHPRATELSAMARRGEVELAIAPQGHRLDAVGELARSVQALIDDGLLEARQLARVSEATYPSDDLFPGQYVEGFDEAWAEVLSTWRSHEGKPPQSNDRLHVETHIMDGRDVFITDDGPLLALCRRLREEHGLPISAVGLVEYVEGRRASSA